MTNRVQKTNVITKNKKDDKKRFITNRYFRGGHYVL